MSTTIFPIAARALHDPQRLGAVLERHARADQRMDRARVGERLHGRVDSSTLGAVSEVFAKLVDADVGVPEDASERSALELLV